MIMGKTYWKLILLLIGIFLFFGGMGIETVLVQYFGIAVGVLMLVLAWFWKKKLVLPHGFILYTLFLLLFLLSLTWSQNVKTSFEYFTLFFGGGLFWLSFYNLQKEIGKEFENILILLGIVFGGLFLTYKITGDIPVKSGTLYTLSSLYKNHNHLGDYWAIILTIAGYHMIRGQKRWHWLLLIPGIYFLTTSLSRTAFLSLAVGGYFVFLKQGWIKGHKKFFRLFLALIVVLFLFTGMQKTTLFSRPYFVQGVVGLFRKPLGVGVGNFGLISSDPANQLLGAANFSSMAHNIVLEVFAGMGFLGMVFAVWLFSVAKSVWNSNNRAVVYQAAFIILMINFFFDTTYFIPAMLWLWFMFLGLAQPIKNEKK